MKRFARLWVAVSTVGLLTLLPATTSSASHVSCGQTITQSTVLDSNIGPCNGPGIVVGADNITLDLRGFRVIGNSEQGAGGQFGGIVLRGRTGVTVVGNANLRARGVVQGFEAGVVIDGGSGNTVRDLNVFDNLGSPTGDPDLGDGIVLLSSADNRLVGNWLLRNGFYDNIAVLGVGSDRNVLQRNLVENALGANGPVNGVGIVTTPVISDFTAGASIFDNQIINNVVRNSTGQGISTSSSVNSVIRENVVEKNGRETEPGNGIGVRFNMLAQRVTNVLVERNVVRANGRGIEVISDGNRIVNNRITDSVRAPGYAIRLGSTPTNNNVVTGNIIDGNVGYGIEARQSSSAVLSDNLVTNNTFAGVFLLMGRNNSVMRNQVHGNGGSGIHLFFSTANQVRDNNAANNMVAPLSSTFARADLFDGLPNCDANVWSANVWGTGGFSPPCVTTAGSGPSPPSP